jgi:hypothetical protein
LLWLAGEDRTALPLAENLSIDVHTVYAARPVALPANAAALIGSCAIVALHSVRAAHRFGEVVDALGLARDEILLAAFSPVVAGSAGDGWGGIAIARHPVDTALLSAAIALVKETEDAPARKAHP